MSEQVHEFPACDRFRVRGHEFEMDAVEAATAFQEILSAMPEGGRQKDYLDQVNAWVQAHGGPDLTLGEAEWFYHYVEQLREEKRAFFRERIGGRQTSPTSTESTPSS